jgi:hypothetical protein
MSYDVRAYDKPNTEGFPPDPIIVLVAEGTHDVSRLIHVLNGAPVTIEQMNVGAQVLKQVRRHNSGRAALELLQRHGGRDFTNPAPLTVLCGSTRFGDAFRKANLDLTLAGHIVLTIGCDTKSDDVLGIEDPGLKDRLDALHLRKIDMADEVYVVNVGGYIGESTGREIAYATRLGLPVHYLEAPALPVTPADRPGDDDYPAEDEFPHRDEVPSDR